MELNRFILGDCMDPETGLPSYPDNSISFVCTDPPYGINYQSSRRTDKDKRFKKIVNDKEPFIDWIKPLYGKMQDGGRVICFYRWDVAIVFIDEFMAAGFNVVQELVWDKVIHGMGDLKASPGPQHETMIYCTKGRSEFNGKRPKTIYRCKRVPNTEMIHPNEKPVQLFKALTRDYGQGICVDFFSGSANSLRAWQEMGLDYIGHEIDPDYYEAAKNRMSKGIQKALF